MKTLRFIIAASFAGAALFIGGCSKKTTVSIDTGKALPSALVETQIRAYVGEAGTWAFTPDSSYAVVNSAWLPGFFERWKADLFAKDVVGWEGRFDCNKFASSYCAAAQLEFYRDKWGTRSPGQALAVGEVWYQPDRSPTGHAIVTAITERGVLFIEPQTGREVRLSKAELASITFKRF
jgi:hypothetical protein